MVNEINILDASPDVAGKQFAIVVSSYNEMITGKLSEAAIDTLQQQGVAENRIDLIRVPGAWELALAARQALETQRYAGVVCLGAVIRGETTHDQHINRFVSQAIGQLSLDSGVPVAFGLLTCQTFDQAHARAGGKVGNKGHEATLAMLQMVHLCDQLKQL